MKSALEIKFNRLIEQEITCSSDVTEFFLYRQIHLHVNEFYHNWSMNESVCLLVSKCLVFFTWTIFNNYQRKRKLFDGGTFLCSCSIFLFDSSHCRFDVFLIYVLSLVITMSCIFMYTNMDGQAIS